MTPDTPLSKCFPNPGGRHWHILGAGAIGGVFACRFQQVGIPVTLLNHRAHSDQTRQLRWHRPLCEIESGKATVDCTFPQDTLGGSEPIAGLLICTKAFAVLPAIEAIRPRLTPEAPVVLMVNGMGIAERLRMLLPQPLYLGSTTTACHRTSINTLNQIAPGATSIGPAGEEPVLPDWSLWTAAIPHLSWRTDIEQVLLEKLAINSAINPLTALHDIPNGVLLKAPYRALFDAVIGEISALLEHANSPYQQGSDLGEVIRTVAKQTAGNTSSMRADYQQGKPTEIEAILGYLVEHFAASLGSPPPTPILGELFNAIRAYERSLSAASPTPHPHQPKK